MASAPTREAVAEPPKSGDLAAVAPRMTASTAAWLCTLPCALLVLLAMLTLGPPLGRLAQGTPDARFLPSYRPYVHLEPTEQGRFLIALAAPLLLSLATALLASRPHRIPRGLQRLAWRLVPGVAIAAIAACLVVQARTRYGPEYTQAQASIGWSYFTGTTLAAAAAFAMLASLALRHDVGHRIVRAMVRESPVRRATAFSVAAAMTVIWLLHAINTDTSIANAPEMLTFHLSFPLDEAFAVVNGLTPLVDFSAQYGALLPWVGALSMSAFGKTLLVFTIAMCSLSALALIAVYDILRRAARSAVAALALYLPVLATSLFKVRGTLLERDTFGTYFGMFPLRYAPAYLVAWLTARQLSRPGSRVGPWLLWSTGGLAILNNVEFGLAATGASVAACACTSSFDRRTLLRLGRAVAIGLGTAFALVSLLTLARAGSLPRLWRLTDYARLYGHEGFGMLPIREPLGLHLVIYVTYVAAIGTATVRAIGGAANRVLTGMLAWSGIFGLGTGSYFAGRSHPEALVASFSAWALALALLTAVAVPALLATPGRRPHLAALAVLFGFGIAACSLAQTPAPWSQATRIDAPFNPEPNASASERPLMPEQRRSTRRFVTSIADGPSHFVVKQGAPVALIVRMGHRAADAFGIVDVTPYTGPDSLETEERVEATLDALRRAGGNTVIAPYPLDGSFVAVLDRHGFAVLTRSGRLARLEPQGRIRDVAVAAWQEQLLMKWVDTRHLHPRFLETTP